MEIFKFYEVNEYNFMNMKLKEPYFPSKNDISNNPYNPIEIHITITINVGMI